MIEDVHHACCQTSHTDEACAKQDVAYLRDRGIGKQTFEVFLKKRDARCEQNCEYRERHQEVRKLNVVVKKIGLKNEEIKT